MKPVHLLYSYTALGGLPGLNINHVYLLNYCLQHLKMVVNNEVKTLIYIFMFQNF